MVGTVLANRRTRHRDAAGEQRKRRRASGKYGAGSIHPPLRAMQRTYKRMQESDQKQEDANTRAFTRGPIMLTLQSDLHGNHLLGALPSHEWQALAPHLELVHLRTEQLLCDSGQRIHHVYFPTTAIISMLSTMEDGSSVEIAAVGREGMTGVPVLTGGETMPNRVQVQCAGFAYRMSAQALSCNSHAPISCAG